MGRLVLSKFPLRTAQRSFEDRSAFTLRITSICLSSLSVLPLMAFCWTYSSPILDSYFLRGLSDLNLSQFWLKRTRNTLFFVGTSLSCLSPADSCIAVLGGYWSSEMVSLWVLSLFFLFLTYRVVKSACDLQKESSNTVFIFFLLW